MKKFVKMLLIGSMVLSLAACEKKEDASSDANTSTGSSEMAENASAEENGEEVSAPDYSGTYTEPVAGRCTIEIEALGENNYKVNVHWSSSAFESANWEINATYYDSTGLLEYTGAKYFVRTYADEENFTDDVKYEDGAGEFWFEENGTLGWRSANSDADGITGETFFEKVDAAQ